MATQHNAHVPPAPRGIVGGTRAAAAQCDDDDAPSTPTGSAFVATTSATTASASEGESGQPSGDEAHSGRSSYPSSDTAAGEECAGGDGVASEAAPRIGYTMR